MSDIRIVELPSIAAVPVPQHVQHACALLAGRSNFNVHLRFPDFMTCIQRVFGLILHVEGVVQTGGSDGTRLTTGALIRCTVITVCLVLVFAIPERTTHQLVSSGFSLAFTCHFISPLTNTKIFFSFLWSMQISSCFAPQRYLKQQPWVDGHINFKMIVQTDIVLSYHVTAQSDRNCRL